MKLLSLAVGLSCLSAAVVVVVGRPDWCPGCPERTFAEYGPDVERFGFCPRNPDESLCDTNFCTQDNHCEDQAKKCCATSCGGLVCVAPIPAFRRPGNCPDFWKVPVKKWPESPINDCDTDDNCTANPQHKCCGTEYHAVRKCVNPV